MVKKNSEVLLATDKLYTSNLLVSAQTDLSLNEEKLLYCAIVVANKSRPYDIDNKTHLPFQKGQPVRVYADEFAKFTGLSQEDSLQAVERACIDLQKRVVKIKLETFTDTALKKKSKNSYLSFVILPKVLFSRDLRFTEMSFHDDFLPFFTGLSGEFFSHELFKIGRLSSIHAIRLYRLFLSHLWQKNGSTQTYSLIELKTIFGIINSYEETKLFVRDFIKPYLAQINKETDLNVTYTNEKVGRSITGFTFSINKKELTTALDSPEVEKIRTGLDDETIDLVLNNHEFVIKYKPAFMDDIEFLQYARKILEETPDKFTDWEVYSKQQSLF